MRQTCAVRRKKYSFPRGSRAFQTVFPCQFNYIAQINSVNTDFYKNVDIELVEPSGAPSQELLGDSLLEAIW